MQVRWGTGIDAQDAPCILRCNHDGEFRRGKGRYWGRRVLSSLISG